MRRTGVKRHKAGPAVVLTLAAAALLLASVSAGCGSTDTARKQPASGQDKSSGLMYRFSTGIPGYYLNIITVTRSKKDVDYRRSQVHKIRKVTVEITAEDVKTKRSAKTECVAEVQPGQTQQQGSAPYELTIPGYPFLIKGEVSFEEAGNPHVIWVKIKGEALENGTDYKYGFNERIAEERLPYK